MTSALREAAREAARLDLCELEPIHIPGAVQARGALVTVDLRDFVVLQATSNTSEILGIEPAELRGKPLVDVIGPEPVAQFREILTREGFGANPIDLAIGERRFDAIFHETSGLGIVEFEPQRAAPRHSPTSVYAAMHRLSRASTVPDLLSWTARELRELTGFDQVMVYTFHADGHGEVVAESVVPGVHSYLGHHFPASDIPIQARKLYLTKLSRLILITDAPDASLEPAANPLTEEPVDLSLAELRAISPRHVQFMRNLGQGATLSLSLVADGELIGMITCANRVPRHVPYALRLGFEVLARQVALQRVAMERIAQLTQRERLRGVRQRIIDRLRGEVTTGDALTGTPSIIDLVPAEWGAARIDGTTFVVGDSPGVDRAAAFFSYLDVAREKYFMSESIDVDRPEVAKILPAVAGVLAVRFGMRGDYVAWFRAEQLTTIDWLGEQSSSNRETPLSPRTSFATWRKSVSGVARPWEEYELLEAAELCRDLDTALRT